MPLVRRWIDVDVWEDVVRRHTYLDACNLGSPEEVPVLINLEIFIPADRLQDVAVGNKAVANERALGNVADASIFATRNVKHTTGRIEQPGRSVWMRAMASTSLIRSLPPCCSMS